MSEDKAIDLTDEQSCVLDLIFLNVPKDKRFKDPNVGLSRELTSETARRLFGGRAPITINPRGHFSPEISEYLSSAWLGGLMEFGTDNKYARTREGPYTKRLKEKAREPLNPDQIEYLESLGRRVATGEFEG